MPIGSSKLGVLGAGLVPGGTETFNAPGTFSIPPGVKKVSITGKGGTGNPGEEGALVYHIGHLTDSDLQTSLLIMDKVAVEVTGLVVGLLEKLL
jgi:hypothetical protein